MNRNKVVLLYDFDCTLARGYMQEPKLAKDLGFDSALDFFIKCDTEFNKGDLDMCLGHMLGTIVFAKRQGFDITEEYLRSCGKGIDFYSGITEWFDKINAIGNKLGLDVEHYVISSGVKEIIDGSAIADKFKRIYGCSFHYDDEATGNELVPKQWMALGGDTVLFTIFNYTCCRRTTIHIVGGVGIITKNTLSWLGTLPIQRHHRRVKKIFPKRQILLIGFGGLVLIQHKNVASEIIVVTLQPK